VGTHPNAGKPADPKQLVNVPRLVAAYFIEHPDPSEPSQLVAFGSPATGARPLRSFNEDHILAVTQAICERRGQAGATGPLFLGMDTHALSEPAFRSALEVLAGNGVEVRWTATGSAPHAGHLPRHSLPQSGRKEGLATGS